jgi:choline transport protein
MWRKISGPPVMFRPFKLGNWGVPINMFSLAYLLYVIIWMPFPTMLPVTGKNINYAGPILLFIIFAAVAD